MGLALTRREGEVVLIEGGIAVKVVKVSGKQVKLLIEAPKGTAINRMEVVAQQKDSK